MAKAKITFQKIIQNEQNLGTFEKKKDHMVSVIHFTLAIEMKVAVQQPYGTDFIEDPIEVGQPCGPYKGVWNHKDFSEQCEQVYRKSFGSEGRGIKFDSSSSNIAMKNNTVDLNTTSEIDLPDDSAAGW